MAGAVAASNLQGKDAALWSSCNAGNASVTQRRAEPRAEPTGNSPADISPNPSGQQRPMHCWDPTFMVGMGSMQWDVEGFDLLMAGG